MEAIKRALTGKGEESEPSPKNLTRKERREAEERERRGDQQAKTKEEPTAWRQLLVLDGDQMHDWCRAFAAVRLSDGSGIRVVQASWMEIEVTVYADSGCLVQVAPVRESDGQVVRPATLTMKPDFVLQRNQQR